MKKRSARHSLLFILLLCLSLLVSACGSAAAPEVSASSAAPAAESSVAATEESTVTSDAPVPEKKEKLHFSWYVHYDWATYMTPWGEDAISKWMDENKNVEIEWIMSGGSAQAKLSTMIASGELPDAITMDRGSELEALAKQGILVPLDDYYGNYPNFPKYGDKKLVNALRSSIDQKWYGMPAWYTSEKYPLGNHGFVVDKKMYDAAGRPELKNLDQVYDYLKDMKTKNPDVVPMMIEDFSIFTTVFGEGRIRDLIWMASSVKDGQIISALDDPEFTDAVLWANKLYREGLLSAEDFANTNEQRDEKFANGKVPFSVPGDCGNGLKTRSDAYRANDPAGAYEVIPSPVKAGLDKSKVTVSSYAMVGWNVTTITQSAKEPERIYEFLDWLTGEEGQAISLYGPQGTYWDNWIDYEGVPMIDLDQPKFKDRNKEEFDKMRGAFSFNWVPNGVWQSVESWYNYNLSPPAEDEFPGQTYIRISRSEATATDEFSGIEPDPTTEVGIAFSSIKETFNKTWLQAILAKSEVDAKAVLGKGKADVDKSGMDSVMNLLNENHMKRLELLNK